MFRESAIDQHLLNNSKCAKNYSDNKFTILSFGRSSFYLSALEAVYTKPCKPNLCCPKKFSLQLENLALITRFDAFPKHPIIFVQLH